MTRHITGNYYGVTDVAKVLGVNLKTFWSAIYERERYPAPTHRLGHGRRLYYSEAEYRQFIIEAEDAEAS